MAVRGFDPSRTLGPAHPLTLDSTQQAVLALPDDESAAILGAPGSGKTSTIVELVADRVHSRGWAADDLLVLAPTRAAATRLRDRIAVRLGVPTNGPLARTANSVAFELVRHAAAADGAAPPVLLTGGDQDRIIKDLLAGHVEAGAGPEWPEILGPDVRALRGFRTELRELLMRATEYGITPARMRDLGRRHERAEWLATADFIDEYLQVLATSGDAVVDAAELLDFAAATLRRAEVAPSVDRLRLVIVDDLQEATQSTLGLLRALAARGVAVIAFGDPDVATSAFRGGEPDALGLLQTKLNLPDARTLVLGHVHRQSAVLRTLTQSITARIGTAAAGQQRAASVFTGSGPAAASDAILLVEEPTPSREISAVARVLREQHLLGGVAFSDMVVIARSGAQLPGIARALALAEVPTRTLAGGRALRDDLAARSLLAVIDVGIGRAELTATVAAELLQGPFGGLDRLTLRRLRLALRTEELAGGGNRSSDELLIEALAAPGRFTTIDHRIGRAAERLAVTLHQVRERHEAGDSIEELLWLVWERSRLAPTWFEQALSAGVTAAEANRNLDGIMAVFTAARRFVEREPERPPRAFLDTLFDAEVPEDTLAPQQADDAVLVTTPNGAVGAEFEIAVVAGVQEGVWPNLRVRGSLLFPDQLVDAVTGVDSATVDARKQVVSDELRMFALAVSRARRQVIITAQVSEDSARSSFFSLIPDVDRLPRVAGRAPLSLRGLTGALRRELVTGNDRQRQAAASALARLSAERVPGADPIDWHGLLDPSTTEPLFGDDPVPVSPSKLEAFEKSPLDWFIDSVAGSQPSTAMGIGTVLHWAMETATDPGIDELWRAVESRWGELSFEAPWLGEAQKATARTLVAGIAEYLADFNRDGKQLIAAEGRFGLDLEPARLNGSIDRVERATDGSVVIVDLKTGSPITRQDDIDAHAQLLAYQLAYAEGRFDDLLAEHGAHRAGGAKLLYVKKGVRGKLYREGVQAPLSDEQLEGFRQRVRQVATAMAAATFEGTVEIDQWAQGNTTSMRLHRVKAVSSD
ncbi:ATP-dependent DNA helicase [Diaminobutyricimonas sp. TR449]|uniref:ATP-dependent helicase n=1 Tax=Diaminobutyricimonas sp. TR449 TaxID=2708076 RepID=UPI001423AA78|nr:ATP-dependent DNA helicase [Diaminobutyricimonas sp. TR449]